MKNLENLIKHSLIFIVTDKKLDRSAWKRAMNSLGAHPDKIETYESFNEAIEALDSKAPTALVSSAVIGDENASGLMAKFRKSRPDRSDAILGILADSKEDVPELEILEHEVDVFLTKPYAANDLKEAFEKTLKAKSELSPIEKKVHKSFTLLNAGETEKVAAAVELFEAKCPKLEIFVRLKAELLHRQGDYANEAKVLKESGLDSYHILSQCFDAYVLDNNAHEAFQLATKLFEKWPLHPKRYSNFIKVCILTANHHSFIDFALPHLPVSSKEHQQAMAAALAISSQSIGHADKAKAIEAATLAARYGRGNKAIVEKALRALLELKQIKIVKRLSNELATEDALSDALAVTDYMVLNLEGEEPFTLFRTGMDLKNRGVRDFRVYEVLLKSAKLAGRKKESLEELVEDAAKHYPEKSEYFRRLVAA